MSTEVFPFYGGPLGNWHLATFFAEGHNFLSSEQYFMWKKACFFGDKSSAALILKSSTPKEAKCFGREVQNFDALAWRAVARDFMYEACWHKFSQAPSLSKVLLSTGDRILAESSPYDDVWGTGLHMQHQDACSPEKWCGTNWLGEVLMAVRADLPSGAPRKTFSWSSP